MPDWCKRILGEIDAYDLAQYVAREDRHVADVAADWEWFVIERAAMLLEASCGLTP